MRKKKVRRLINETIADWTQSLASVVLIHGGHPSDEIGPALLEWVSIMAAKRKREKQARGS